ncbi:MAG: hypothetical protein LC627_05740, partial [Verrucomicrobiaceae bacterium]|nr:hypothetical protein [Verrucomicrobiaceae bacterium]
MPSQIVVMLDSFVFYLSLAVVLSGLLSLIRPLRFLGIRTRLIGAIVGTIGLVAAVVTLSLPVRTHRVAVPATRLDDWMPNWQFGEKHITHVQAPPENVFRAIHAVRADEILFFRTLTAIRRCGRPGPESILDAPEKKPILDVAINTSFVLLAEEPPRELVIGTVVLAPSAAHRPQKLEPDLFRKELPAGMALATMNFEVTPDEHGGSTVTSETRVYANGAATIRRFAVYWRIIHPGSDIIRRMWLKAIKHRAEAHVDGT